MPFCAAGNVTEDRTMWATTCLRPISRCCRSTPPACPPPSSLALPTTCLRLPPPLPSLPAAREVNVPSIAARAGGILLRRDGHVHACVGGAHHALALADDGADVDGAGGAAPARTNLISSAKEREREREARTSEAQQAGTRCPSTAPRDAATTAQRRRAQARRERGRGERSAWLGEKEGEVEEV